MDHSSDDEGQPKLIQRISQIEDEDRDQQSDIDLLKTARSGETIIIAKKSGNLIQRRNHPV